MSENGRTLGRREVLRTGAAGVGAGLLGVFGFGSGAALDRHSPVGQVRVEIDDIEVPGWSSVTLPSHGVGQEVSVRGRSVDRVTVNRSSDDLVLTRERKDGDMEHTLRDWHEQTRRAPAGSRRRVAVVLPDEDGDSRDRWEFKRARIAEYDPPYFDPSPDDGLSVEDTKEYDPPDLDSSPGDDPEHAHHRSDGQSHATESVVIVYDEMHRTTR